MPLDWPGALGTGPNWLPPGKTSGMLMKATVCKLRALEKASLRKVHFSGDRLEVFDFLRIACSLGIPQRKKPLNLIIKSPIFTNTPCKSTRLYNAPGMHTVDETLLFVPLCVMRLAIEVTILQSGKLAGCKKSPGKWELKWKMAPGPKFGVAFW